MNKKEIQEGNCIKVSDMTDDDKKKVKDKGLELKLNKAHDEYPAFYYLAKKE